MYPAFVRLRIWLAVWAWSSTCTHCDWQASSISFGDSDQHRQEAYKAHAHTEAKTFEPQVKLALRFGRCLHTLWLRMGQRR